MNRSESDLNATPISELCGRFAELARGKGPFWPFYPRDKSKQETPDHQAAVAEFRQVAFALLRRASPEDVRPLFDSQDSDVRGYAWSNLHALNEEYALAAFRGVEYGLPTQQVYDLTRRAREPPSAHLTPAEMSEDELVARFVDVATRIYGTRFFYWTGEPEDQEIRNGLIGEEIAVVQELKARRALKRLVSLLDDPNPVIRLFAAAYCLQLATEKSIAILEAQAAVPYLQGAELLEQFDAQAVLDRWRCGQPGNWGPE